MEMNIVSNKVSVGYRYSPCIMCVQYIGRCSVHREVFSTSGDTMSTLRGYHEYIEGIS